VVVANGKSGLSFENAKQDRRGDAPISLASYGAAEAVLFPELFSGTWIQ